MREFRVRNCGVALEIRDDAIEDPVDHPLAFQEALTPVPIGVGDGKDGRLAEDRIGAELDEAQDALCADHAVIGHAFPENPTQWTVVEIAGHHVPVDLRMRRIRPVEAPHAPGCAPAFEIESVQHVNAAVGNAEQKYLPQSIRMPAGKSAGHQATHAVRHQMQVFQGNILLDEEVLQVVQGTLGPLLFQGAHEPVYAGDDVDFAARWQSMHRRQPEAVELLRITPESVEKEKAVNWRFGVGVRVADEIRPGGVRSRRSDQNHLSLASRQEKGREQYEDDSAGRDRPASRSRSGGEIRFEFP